MNDDNKMADQLSSNRAATPTPKSYNFLLKMSKRLGRIATESFVEVKDFLNKEITVEQQMSPTERFLSGMPRIRLQRHRNERDPQRRHEEERMIRDGQARLDSVRDLKKIIEQSHEVLAAANTVFPITLFPDTVFVDRTKVTIIRRDFFWSSDTLSIRIEDVLNVSATVGPLFGSLTIASRVMSTIDHFQIRHLWRNDAVHLKQVIQGYVIAQHNKIDIAHLSKEELVKTLVEIGHDTNR